MSSPTLPLQGGAALALRPYQQEAIEGLYRWFAEHDTGNPLIVLPTGSGKSLVMAELVRDALHHWPDTRFLVLAHVKELLEQNAKELWRHIPALDLGIYSAGLRSRDIRNQVLVASIQSVYRRAFDLGRFDLILVDEAHLIPRTSDTMYQTFLGQARLVNPDLRVVGLTATDYRMDSGRLTEGEDRFFHGVAHEVGVAELIREGYLTRVTTRRTVTQLDTSGVHTRGGEFIPGELARAVDLEAVTRAAVAEIVEAGKDRLAWLVFCSSVEHAGHVAEALRAHGVTAGVVTGETPTADRDRLIAEFKAGRLRALCNMNVLTTGFNVPHVDLLALLRPTKSPGLYVQMVGRGTRNSEGKTDCLVLDFGGNCERFGPIDCLAVAANGRDRDGPPGEAPVKTCPKCRAYVLIALLVCPECGHEFPPPPPKLTPKPTRAAVLSDEQEPEWINVSEVEYSRHEKAGKPPSLRVTYRFGFLGHQRVSEWVCLEHSGYAREKAAWWWRQHAGMSSDVPRTVEEALFAQEELRPVSAICVRKEGKYERVVGCRFAVDSRPPAGNERDAGRADAGGSGAGPRPAGQEMERLLGHEAPLGGGGCFSGAPGEDCPF